MNKRTLTKDLSVGSLLRHARDTEEIVAECASPRGTRREDRPLPDALYDAAAALFEQPPSRGDVDAYVLEVQAIHGVKLRAGDFDTAWNALIDWWSKRTVKEERRESIAAMLLAVTDDRRGSAVRFAAAGDGSPVAGRRLEADPKAGILRRSSHGRRASKPPRMPSFCEDEEMRESFAASFNKGGSHPGVDAADEAWESSEAERLKDVGGQRRRAARLAARLVHRRRG